MLQFVNGSLVLFSNYNKLLSQSIMKIYQTLVRTPNHTVLAQSFNHLQVWSFEGNTPLSMKNCTFVSSFFLSATVLISLGSAVIRDDSNLLHVLINGPHSSHLHYYYYQYHHCYQDHHHYHHYLPSLLAKLWSSCLAKNLTSCQTTVSGDTDSVLDNFLPPVRNNLE